MLTIVIPFRSDDVGLWFTVHGLHSELSGDNWSILAVNNGEESPAAFRIALRDKKFRLLTLANPQSPQAARDFGIRNAPTEWVLCVDSHVLFKRGSIKSLFDFASINPGLGIAYPLTSWEEGEPPFGAFQIDWHGLAWKHGAYEKTEMPVRVGVCNHGAFLIRKSAYLDCGGYMKEQRGWGGEESHLGLKMWMFGWESWLVPEAHQWHLSTRRSYPHGAGHIDFARNFLLSAFALGGKRQLALTDSFIRKNYASSYDGRELIEAIREAPLVAAQERLLIESKARIKDIFSLQRYFREEGVLC